MAAAELVTCRVPEDPASPADIPHSSARANSNDKIAQMLRLQHIQSMTLTK
jgi:hypothetical protein